jgi:hypothetical protein
MGRKTEQRFSSGSFERSTVQVLLELPLAVHAASGSRDSKKTVRRDRFVTGFTRAENPDFDSPESLADLAELVDDRKLGGSLLFQEILSPLKKKTDELMGFRGVHPSDLSVFIATTTMRP